MKHIVVYIHGKGGNAAEAEYDKQFFQNAEVIGFDYKAQPPREAEAELRSKKEISVPGGETLSWKYYCYAREHAPAWLTPALNPAHIICGDRDMLTPPEKMRVFAAKIGASVAVMPGGEHWFHTPEQMRFLNAQITRFSGGFHKKT